ncbi:MAG TPA: type IX secretion system sortase PorU, partial [Candidatus Krumholzibacteria bacterium]|nr:type IX secretion system sortase PorU [Candidatus Krumholzibacteria bacterium]
LASIDPSSLRLYTQGGLNQPRDLNDPAGSWRTDQAMREVRMRVEAGNDGTFDPGDRIVFYGVGTNDWQNYYDATAPDSIFHKHTHAATNYYFLAWGGTLPGTPARMSDVDATPIAAPDYTTHLHREYRERDLVQDFDYRGDGWLWLDLKADARSYRLSDVDVSNLVASSPQEFRSLALARPDTIRYGHHAVFFDTRSGNNTTIVGDKVWNTPLGTAYYDTGVPIHLTGNFLQPGVNTIAIQVPGDRNAKDTMYFAWFALRYTQRNIATGDALGCSTPDTTGAVNLSLRGFSSSGTLWAFDVTDPWNPSRLINTEVTTAGAERLVRAGFNVAGTPRQVWVATTAGLKKPGVSRYVPVDLRADPVGPNMLIISNRDLGSAADRLRAYRAAGRLPLYSNPVVKLVTVDQVYDNFSAGMPDPMALRNYIKYLYDNYQDANGNPRLAYVVLFGDATEDFQNHVSSEPNFVPSNLYFTYRSLYAFSTDDWFGDLDPQDQVAGHAVLDVALGRLPASSSAEADLLVDKIIAYEGEAPTGDWRQRIVLVADDQESSQSSCETEWNNESELISMQHIPDFVALQKIYLTEYPQVGRGVKPTSRLALLNAWNQGALHINYIGHGSNRQLADELVFVDSDVSQLNNGLKLPIFTAFSCTVGDFANPADKSLSEKMLLREEGGAIGTVTGSRETYADPNRRLCFALFDQLYPDRLPQARVPVGVALMHAKLSGQTQTSWLIDQEENSWKYNLLCDPALLPRIPEQEIHFATAPAETLVAGLRHTVRGAVYSGTSVDTKFNGVVAVTVREPQLHRTYAFPNCPGFVSRYYLPGGPIYQGTVDAVDGQFEVNFRVPRYAASGPLAYAGSYAYQGTHDAANSVDSVFVVVEPTLADSTALKPVDGAPRVELGFKSGLTLVKTGDTVRARVHDGDGINILNTTNEGRQAILIDNLPVPIDVNEFFSFDHGGTDTSGVLLYPLPELRTGHHRLVYKVSDSFGLTTLDTLHFDVTDAANYYAEVPFNYPNPFKDSTKFLVRASNRASIKLELYTVSGKFVRRIETLGDGGETWIEWDGRNQWGGDVANGSYLYVATVHFMGIDRPPVVLRGRLSRIR